MKNSNVSNTLVNKVQMNYWNPKKKESRSLKSLAYFTHIRNLRYIIKGTVSIISGLKQNKKEGMVLITWMIVLIR